MRWSSVARAPPAVRGERARRAAQHTPRDARDAHAGHVVEAVGRAADNRRGGAPSAPDRGPDPLAEIAAREPGGIAGDEGVVAPHDIDPSAQEIAVARRVIGRAPRQPAVELRGQMRPVRLDVLAGALDALGKAADADIEPAALLRHVPGVSGQPLVAEPQVTVPVLPVVLDLMLERHDLQLVRARVELAEEAAVHRAARAAGADEIAAAVSAVDQVTVAVRDDVAHVVLLDERARALEQPRGPLEGADGMLYARDGQAQASVVHPEAREGEEAMRVRVDIHLELAYHLGRDPARTELEARKALAVENQYLGPFAFQAPGGARARGPAADNDDLTRAHEQSGRVQVRARPGNVVVVGGREHHLEQLQRTGGEPRDRAREIQPPHAHELLIEHGPHALGRPLAG